VKGELVFVPAGGSQCGLIAFDLRDGTVRWKSPAAEPSYATPVLTEIHGHAVIVWITRDAVQIIDSSSGRLLGSEPLPKQKLTNVPQPLVIDGRRLIISAQGTDDIRAWDITPEFTFRERWKGTKPRFFYCNWLPTQGLVFGHGEGKFLALDPANGKILWEDLRLKDANLIADRDGNALILRGDGLLVSAKITREELIRNSELQLLKDRCWTPPTVREGTLYVRNAREIVALKLRP
jgi:outer membrane protein assembly factor BamB